MEALPKLSPWAFGEICRFRSTLESCTWESILETWHVIGHVPIPNEHVPALVVEQSVYDSQLARALLNATGDDSDLYLYHDPDADNYT